MALLASACRSNDVNRALSVLFKDPKLLDQADMRTGKSPLHLCAEFDSVDVAKILLEKKADVNVPANGPTFSQWTPLHFAYEHNQQAMVQLLLRNGADEAQKNFNDELPKDRLEVWRRLNESKTSGSGASGGRNRRISFLEAGRMVKLEGLVSRAAQAARRLPMPVQYSKACSLAARGKVGRLKNYLDTQAKLFVKEKEEAAAEAALVAAGGVAFLKLKAEKKPKKLKHHEFCVDDYDAKTGLNPLHIACNNEDLDVCKVLVEAKAHLEVKSRGTVYQGWTPLHFAYRRNAEDIIQFLLSAKADAEQTTDAGELPTALLKIWEKVQAKNVVLRKARMVARISKKEKQKQQGLDKVRSKLCHAVKKRSMKHLNRALDTVPPPTLDECERSTGFAALHIAAGARSSMEVSLGKHKNKGPWIPGIRLLLERKADVNYRTRDKGGIGSTPLHFAYEQNCKEAIALLLKHGADPNAADLNKKVPEHRLEIWQKNEEREQAAEARRLERERKEEEEQRKQVEQEEEAAAVAAVEKEKADRLAKEKADERFRKALALQQLTAAEKNKRKPVKRIHTRSGGMAPIRQRSQAGNSAGGTPEQKEGGLSAGKDLHWANVASVASRRSKRATRAKSLNTPTSSGSAAAAAAAAAKQRSASVTSGESPRFNASTRRAPVASPKRIGTPSNRRRISEGGRKSNTPRSGGRSSLNGAVLSRRSTDASPNSEGTKSQLMGIRSAEATKREMSERAREEAARKREDEDRQLDEEVRKLDEQVAKARRDAKNAAAVAARRTVGTPKIRFPKTQRSKEKQLAAALPYISSPRPSGKAARVPSALTTPRRKGTSPTSGPRSPTLSVGGGEGRSSPRSPVFDRSTGPRSPSLERSKQKSPRGFNLALGAGRTSPRTDSTTQRMLPFQHNPRAPQTDEVASSNDAGSSSDGTGSGHGSRRESSPARAYSVAPLALDKIETSETKINSARDAYVTPRSPLGSPLGSPVGSFPGQTLGGRPGTGRSQSLNPSVLAGMCSRSPRSNLAPGGAGTTDTADDFIGARTEGALGEADDNDQKQGKSNTDAVKQASPDFGSRLLALGLGSGSRTGTPASSQANTPGHRRRSTPMTLSGLRGAGTGPPKTFL